MLRLLCPMVIVSTKSASQRFVSFRSLSRFTPPKRDFYDVLGVDRHSSTQQIKDAYIALSKKYHPDNDVANPKLHARFLAIKEAYDALNTAHKRKLYDLTNGRMQVEKRFYPYAGGPPEKKMKKRDVRWTVTVAGVKYTVNPFSGWTLTSLLLSSWLVLTLVIYILMIIFW